MFGIYVSLKLSMIAVKIVSFLGLFWALWPITEADILVKWTLVTETE